MKTQNRSGLATPNARMKLRCISVTREKSPKCQLIQKTVYNQTEPWYTICSHTLTTQRGGIKDAKNFTLVILILVVIVITYKYVELRNELRGVESHISLNDISEKENKINFYEENDPNFFVESGDKKFRILFEYEDKVGLKSFSLEDDVSHKRIYYNFTEDGLMSSHKYTDGKYGVVTNITDDPDVLIARQEYYEKFTVIYKLFADGTSEINRIIRDRDATLW
jgi:hypothetical protein